MSLVLAENFLSKYLLVCTSSGTRGKIQIWGFFGQKVSKNGHFLPKIQFLKVLTDKERFLTVSFSPLGLKVGKKACMLLFDPKGG